MKTLHAAVVIATVAATGTLLTLAGVAAYDQHQLRENVNFLGIINQASTQRGTPEQRFIIQGYRFKTDASGDVFMHYSDGWYPIGIDVASSEEQCLTFIHDYYRPYSPNDEPRATPHSVAEIAQWNECTNTYDSSIGLVERIHSQRQAQ